MNNNAESGRSDNPKTSSNMDTTSMYMMTDIKIFIRLLQLVSQCPECSNAITTTVDFSSKKGLAQKVVPSCKAAKIKQDVFGRIQHTRQQ